MCIRDRYSILNENGLDIVKIIDALKYTLEPGGVVTGERDKYTMSARRNLPARTRLTSARKRYKLSAVSYTHLDVYKRQATNNRGCARCGT